MLLCLLICVLTLGCGSKPEIEPQLPYWVDNDRTDIPEPESVDPHVIWTSVERSTFDQAKLLLDIERNIRILSDNREQAANINSYDEVPNSTWFTNRHHINPLSPEEIRKGVNHTPGPDTSGIWYVFRPKVGGATPGFWIEDSRGDQYVIKFDPPDNPEMATAASAMGSRFFHACGYNVSQETIVRWRPEKLRIKDGATIKIDGKKRPMTQEDINNILKLVHIDEDGTIRSLASLSLGREGEIKGPFLFDGRRKDDPNDWFDHEDRRELRGLYVIASLVNHYDVKDQNTLDVYVEENGNNFLKHYLFDFASTFGSDGSLEKIPKKGYANTIDVRDVGISMITLGLKVWPWEHAQPYSYASVGYFESDIFEPNEFDCIIPNPAWDEMTNRDAYWGAKVVMSWRDEHLRALVESGEYSDSLAEDYVLETLRHRRNKIGRHWFAKVNPLDNFELQDNGTLDRSSGEGLAIGFEDLAAKYGLEMDNAIYQADIKLDGKRVIEKADFSGQKMRFRTKEFNSLVTSILENRKNGRDDLIKIDIRTKRINRDWSKPVRLWLGYDESYQRFRLVGIEHID